MSTPTKKVAFHTLGCKLNFSETSSISRDFITHGYEKVPIREFADIYVINTCSVTENANKEILVIPLLEEKETIDDFEALATMPGLDVFFLGTFDFSVSAGVPGAGFDHPIVAAALERVVSLAKANGKYVMTTVGDNINIDYARDILSRGVQMISYSADALVFRRACLDIAALKVAAEASL